MKRSLIFFGSLLILGLNMYSQERFSVYLAAGASKLKEIDNDQTSSFENFYSNAACFSAGFNYKILNGSVVFPSASLSFSARGATNNIPESYGSTVASTSWTERYYTANGSLKLNYVFEPWLLFNCSLTGSFPISFDDSWEKEEVPFVYTSLGIGAEVVIDRIYLALDYYIGLSPTREFTWADIRFNERLWLIGIGYKF